jgi:hypothetical protein
MVPAELDVRLVESAVPLPGPTLQFLPPADKDQGTQVRGSADAEGTRGEEPQNSANNRVPGRRATRGHYGSTGPRSTPG